MSRNKRTQYIVKTKDGKVHHVNPEQGILPLLPNERHLGYYAMIAIMTAGAIASWAFVTGTAIGVLIPVKYGIAAALFGCTVSFAIHGYQCITYNRYGTDMSIVGRRTWGHIGIYVVILAIGYPATYGWGSMPIIMLGRSGATLLGDAGITGIFADWRFWSFMALFAGLLITYAGTHIIDKITNVAAPIVVALIIFIIVVLAKDYGISESFNSLPMGVDGDRETLLHNYMIAVEICLGVGFSWPYYISAFVKPAASENGAYTPSVLGCGVAWALCAVAPAMTAALSGLSDPVEALHSIGGSYASMWMLMLFVANLSSVMVNPYFLSVGLTSLFPKLKWKYAVLIQLIYAVAIVFPVFYDQFGMMISFIGMAEAPIGAVWAVDCFINKKINLRHCYAKTIEDRKKSAYWYFHGFRISSYAGWFIGMGFGVWMYNPYTGEIASEGFFNLFGAMFPAAIVGVVVYLLVYYLYEKPRQISHVDQFQTIEEYHAKQIAK